MTRSSSTPQATIPAGRLRDSVQTQRQAGGAAANKRTPPPPSVKDRDKARIAAIAMRAAIVNPLSMGEQSVAHLDLARPRRGEWWTTWANLPGFARVLRNDGTTYSHALLPGWEYVRAEILSEMIPDLEALAERGERPVEATRS